MVSSGLDAVSSQNAQSTPLISDAAKPVQENEDDENDCDKNEVGDVS